MEKHRTNLLELGNCAGDLRKVRFSQRLIGNEVYGALVSNLGQDSFTNYQHHVRFEKDDLAVLEKLREVFNLTVDGFASDPDFRAKHPSLDDQSVKEILCNESYNLFQFVFRQPYEETMWWAKQHPFSVKVLKLEDVMEKHLGYLFSSEEAFRVLTELKNFSSATPIALDKKLTIREIGDDDYSKIASTSDQFEAARELGQYFCIRGAKTSVIELRIIQSTFSDYKIEKPEFGKNRQHPYHRPISEQDLTPYLWRVISTLRLFQEGNVELGWIYYLLPSPTMKCQFDYPEALVAPLHSYHLKDHSNHYHVDSPEKAQAVERFWNLCSDSGLPPRLDRAKRRFVVGYQKHLLEDELIDLVTCLETLFTTDDKEVSFKACLRACQIRAAGREFKEKKEVFDLLRTAYDWRSKLVHGSENNLPEKIRIKASDSEYTNQEFVHSLRQHVREIISLFLGNSHILSLKPDKLSTYYDNLCLGIDLSELGS